MMRWPVRSDPAESVETDDDPVSHSKENNVQLAQGRQLRTEPGKTGDPRRNSRLITESVQGK